MCALHFRDAHVEANRQMLGMLRRMREMARGLSSSLVGRPPYVTKLGGRFRNGLYRFRYAALL